jgi:hypothetical protein
MPVYDQDYWTMNMTVLKAFKKPRKRPYFMYPDYDITTEVCVGTLFLKCG